MKFCEQNDLKEKILYKTDKGYNRYCISRLNDLDVQYLLSIHPDLKTASYILYEKYKFNYTSIVKCKHCGKCLSFDQIKKRKKCCSHLCQMRLSETIEKRKSTTKEKYGCSNNFLVNFDQIKKRNLEEYGVEYYFQSDEFKEKSKKTHLEKYGVENISLLGNGKYKDGSHPGVPHINYDYIQDFLDKKKSGDFINDKEFIEFIEKSGMSISHSYKYFKKFNLSIERTKSQLEIKITNFLDELGIKYETNNRKIIHPLELDIFIPAKNIAIEINGLYWHSFQENGDKNYHLRKTEECEKKGIQLLHIFENEILNDKKFNIWKSVIKNKLGLSSNKIYARKCEKRIITNDEAIDFCEQNHLQGGISSKINIGLFYNNELVQVATFSKPRFNKKYEWELIRLCQKLDFNVIGGSSKLLKGFNNLISYANRRWSFGNVYNQLGFKMINKTNPNYFYFKDFKELFSRNQFQKHKLKNKLKYFNENLTEYQNMENNGYKWIYDSGNLVFIK